MRCPGCAVDDDKVVDSRATEDGGAVRRRRECLGCGTRFTTYERLEEVPLLVAKRDDTREPFDRAKVVGGVRIAATDRPVSDTDLDVLAGEVEEELRMQGPVVTSERVGIEVLERLRRLDQVAAVRFASVYKGFDDPADFAREVTELSKRSL